MATNNRYSDLTPLTTLTDQFRNKGTNYLPVVKYPEIQKKDTDVYIITEWGDRLDNLAYQFYNDIKLYWVIVAANPNKLNYGSYFPPVGAQLRLPQDLADIKDAYNELNEII